MKDGVGMSGGAAGALVRAIWRAALAHLPMWFIVLLALGHIHAALWSFPDAGFAALGMTRAPFAWTILFPWVWVLAYFGLLIYRSRVRRQKLAWAVLAVFGAGVPLLMLVPHSARQLHYDELTTIFEVGQLVWVALFAVQILATRGGHALVTFFGVTFIYGLMLENTGIVMDFFHEPQFRWYLGPLPAPLCTMLGWSVIFYVTFACTERFAGWIPWLQRGVMRRALCTTALALSLDAQGDPVASMSGVFWRWNDLLLPGFLGVPLVNWAAWFGAFLPYSWFLFALGNRPDLTPGRRNWELFLRVPLSAFLGGVLCFAIMAVIEGGFDGPSFQVIARFLDRLLPY